MLYFASKSDRYVVVDANRPIEVIAEEIVATVTARFKDRLPTLA
jgi:thymidylate kinase